MMRGRVRHTSGRGNSERVLGEEEDEVEQSGNADMLAESEQLGTLPHMHLHTALYADTLAESEQLGTLPHMHLAHCPIC